MIPYLDKLSEHTIGVVLGIGYWEGSDTVVCTLMFQSELEDDCDDKSWRKNKIASHKPVKQ